MLRSIVAAVAVPVALSLVLLGAIPRAFAAGNPITVTVTTTADSGAGSLRAALATLLASPSGGTIVFNLPAGAQTITLTTSDASSTGTTLPAAPFGPTGLVVLAKTVTIDGTAVTGGLTITTSITQRLFAVTGGRATGTGNTAPAAASLTLVNVTLSGGTAQGGAGGSGTYGGGGAAGLGGGVFVDAGSTLVIDRCLVTACQASGGSIGGGGGQGGGGLAGAGDGSGNGGSTNGGAVSTTAANGSDGGFGGGGGGGGTNSPAGGNGGFGGGGGGGGTGTSAGNGGRGGNGGFGGGCGSGAIAGFAAYGNPGFGGGGGASAIPAAGSGAGLGGGVFSNGGTLTVVNSTFTGCSASGGTGGNPSPSGLGGAIFQRNGTAKILFSTLAFNTATDGGALYALADTTAASDGSDPSGTGSTTLTINSSILSNSVLAPHDAVSAVNVGGTFTVTSKTNVVPTQNFTPTIVASSTDPNLSSSLASNGGRTKTLAFAGASVAIGASASANVTDHWFANGANGVDQTGYPRSTTQPNIGAFERPGTGTVFVVDTLGEPTGTGTTLRDAIYQASEAGASTITFAPALAGKTITLTQTDPRCLGAFFPIAPFGSTAFVVTNGDAITIDGSAAPGLVIDTTGTTQRLFAVTGGRTTRSGNAVSASGGSLTLKNLTLSGGKATGGAGGGGAAGLGAALFLDAGSSATLEGCLVTACTAQGGAGGTGPGVGGGGLGSGAGRSGGDPDGGAGGVDGTAGSIIPPPFGTAGTAGSVGGFGGGGGGGGNGAGAFTPGSIPGAGAGGGFAGGGGTAGSTGFPGAVAGGAGGFGGGGGGGGGNPASAGGAGGFAGGAGSSFGAGGGAGFGGGIFVNGGTLAVANSTITGCSALGGAAGGSSATAGSGLGGAIFQRNGTVTILFSTLASNTAGTDGGALYTLGDLTALGDGSGGTTATLTVDGSILSGSTNGTAAVNDFTSNTWDGTTLGAGGTVTIAASTANVVLAQSAVSGTLAVIAGNADPLLSALASNGGPTRTLALGSGSPAIAHGDAALQGTALPNGAGGTDQRGFARRTGGCDVGAFEVQPASIQKISGDSQSAAPGQPFALPVVLEVDGENGGPLPGVPVTLTPPSSGYSVSFGPGPFVTGANGRVSLSATANGIAGGPYPVPATITTPSGPVSVNIGFLNQAPVPVLTVTGGGGGSVSAGSFGLVFTGTVVASDPSQPGFAGDTLTVTVSSGGSAADRLTFDVNQVQLAGSTILVGGVPVGSFTGGSAGAPLVVTFGKGATASSVELVVGSVVYAPDAGDVPGSVTITAVLASSAATSAPATSTVSVAPGGGGAGVTILSSPGGTFVPAGHSSSGCVVSPRGGDPSGLAALGLVLLGLGVGRRRAARRRAA